MSAGSRGSRRALAAAAAAASDMGHLLTPLHWTGVLRHPRCGGRPALLYRLYTAAVSSFALCFICSEAVALLHDDTGDMDVIILLVSTINTASIWIIRMVHCAVYERDFHNLAFQVGRDFAEFLTWEDVPAIRSQSRPVRRFTRAVVWFGVAACSFFLVTPVGAEGLPFILALPYDASTPLGFAVSWLFCTITCMHAVVMTLALDSFNVSLIAQLRIQVALLSKKIVRLAREMSQRPIHSPETSSYQELYSRLKRCVLHHQAIIRNVELLERRLGSILLAQSISIGAVACFQMFQIATSANGARQVTKFGCYLTTSLTELFVYCWLGDDLITELYVAAVWQATLAGAARPAQAIAQKVAPETTLKRLLPLFMNQTFGLSTDRPYPSSENLAMAAYEALSALQGCPMPIKRSLLLLMQRAQRPLCITAGGFFPLSRESYVAVLNVSYSFFAILRNFKEEEQLA